MMATEFERLVGVLSDGKTPRVWSLLITIFGDLAQGPNQWISGATLNQITAQIGIKPEATRVALHRLRKDGWITSRRSGRNSEYSLTTMGRSECATASPRIYGAARTDTHCQLVIAAPGEAATRLRNRAGADAYWITGNIALIQNQVPDGYCTVSVDQIDLADWMRDQVCDASLVAAFAQLYATFSIVEQCIQPIPDLSPIQIAVLRVLVVHGWRRVILRIPDLPDAVFPKAWQGPACRECGLRLLATFPRTDLNVAGDVAMVD